MPIRHPVGGVGVGPLILAPNNVFSRNVTALAAAEDQTPAKRAANQLEYSHAAYSYNGEPAPKFYGYEGIGYGTSLNPKANITTFTPSLFVVPGTTPTQKVTYVNPAGEPQPPGTATNLQGTWENVPMPDVTKVPAGALVAGGTDKELAVWRPSTDEYWEFFKLEGEPGAYKAHYGGYIPEVSKWNGIFPHLWGARACSLMLMGGVITMQDLFEVLQGKKIKHALALVLYVTKAGGPVPPATRCDEEENTVAEHEGQPNPAKGTVDAVAEGTRLRLPPTAKPGEYGLTKLLEVAVFEMAREYGIIVVDQGSVQFDIECPVASGSPYAFNVYNPLAGAPAEWGSFPYIPGSMTKEGLGHFEEAISGPGNAFAKQPWQIAEVVVAQSS